MVDHNILIALRDMKLLDTRTLQLIKKIYKVNSQVHCYYTIASPTT